MKYSLFDIENAFEFVSSGPQEMNSAVLDRKTGTIYYIGDAVDDDVPDDLEDEKYLSIPHKNELDLGKPLVLKYVYENLPENYELIDGFFRHSGAYSNYKNYLAKIGKLDEWHSFEEKAIKEAIQDWCKENNLEVE